MQARDVDAAVLASGSNVRVSISSSSLRFAPIPDTAAAALVFFPGAIVDPVAYTPMARAIAEAGFEVVILPLPYRLAVLDRHEADLAERTIAVVESDVADRAWVVGGHSRGGALAAAFVRDHEATTTGLLLLGTSHPREDDLSRLRIDVAKVFASEDGLASEAEVHQFAPNLPPSTHWTRIEGGNHAQFAWYGWQIGDHGASISREEQQEITVRAIIEQLQRVTVRPTPTPVPPEALLDPQ